jgi:Flp pilus assembly protein TadD
MRSLETASTLDPALTDAPAYAALSRGLLERENGNFAAAEAALREAVTQNSELSAAWRGLAALALRAHKHGEVMDHCRRALMQNPRDEHAYLLLTASCWRAGQRQFAHDAASRIASLRGAGWTPERVLQEVVG